MTDRDKAIETIREALKLGLNRCLYRGDIQIIRRASVALDAVTALLADEAEEASKPESSRLIECPVCGNLEGAPYEQGDTCSMCGIGVFSCPPIPITIVERKLKEAR